MPEDVEDTSNLVQKASYGSWSRRHHTGPGLEGIQKEVAFHQKQEKEKVSAQKKGPNVPGRENKMYEDWEVRERGAYLEQLREGQYSWTIDEQVEVAARLGQTQVVEDEQGVVGGSFYELTLVGKAHKDAVLGTGEPCIAQDPLPLWPQSGPSQK